LAVLIDIADTNVVQGVPLSLIGVIDGLASSLAWDFGDGVVSSNLSYLTSHAWPNPGDYTITFAAFNNDNPAGISTNVTIQVVPLLEPELSAGSRSSNSFTLNLLTQPGVNYAVEQTTNLAPPVVWSPAKSVIGTGGLLPVTDAAATNDMRFYRARVP
jgi:PKD repeat protein